MPASKLIKSEFELIFKNSSEKFDTSPRHPNFVQNMINHENSLIVHQDDYKSENGNKFLVGLRLNDYKSFKI